MKITDDNKEALIDFLVDTWGEAMDERDLINFYRERTRNELECADLEDLQSHAETYDYEG